MAAQQGSKRSRQSETAARQHHALRLLHKAVKKSKTFEVQKLTRKVKQTREPKDGKVDAAAADDLDAQLTALKKLDINAIPPHILKTRIAKFGPLRSVLYLPALLSSIPSTPKWLEYAPTSAESKARNRILANKAVGEAWDEVARAIRKRLGEEVEPKDKGKGKAKEEPPKKDITMDPGRQAAIEAAFLAGGAGEAGGEEGEQEDGQEANEDADEETSEDEGPAAGFSSGVEESDADDDEAIQRELAALGGDGDSDSEGEWSDSGDEDDAAASVAGAGKGVSAKRKQPSLSPSPPPVSSKKAKTAAQPSKPITSSSFLPTLASGYVSYSDSDGEEARWIKEEERKDQKDKRKNRRGQRARQAIWEKKYGSAAAHVVKANGGKPAPLAKVKEQKAKRVKANAGRPAPASYTESSASAQDYAADAAPPARRERPTFTEPQADLGWKKRADAKAATEAAEKVHPSWEAKRKAAEALKQSAALKPQGKKITFD
ncbi:hypothetical protein JCM8202v2_002466 [Rhodotorula sphaerocarpa]